MIQSELFETIDNRQEFIIYRKYAIKRRLGWQDFIASDLIRLGDYEFRLNSLVFELMDEDDLLKLGYTIITPSREMYKDKLPVHIVVKTKVEFPRIYIEGQF